MIAKREIIHVFTNLWFHFLTGLLPKDYRSLKAQYLQVSIGNRAGAPSRNECELVHFNGELWVWMVSIFNLCGLNFSSCEAWTSEHCGWGQTAHIYHGDDWKNQSWPFLGWGLSANLVKRQSIATVSYEEKFSPNRYYSGQKLAGTSC